MRGDSDRRAYDRGNTIFSPDGRLYQVEYAREAVRRGSATVGVKTDESVVFASDASVRSPLLDPDSVEKLHDVDGRLGVASAGHVADARRLVDGARRFTQSERLRYGEAPGVETTARAIADDVQEATQSGGSRPFGVALLVGGYEGGDADARPRLFETDPSGTPSEWRATAIGRGGDAIREYLETEHVDGLDAADGVGLALDALAVGSDADLDAATTGVAVMDADGYRPLDDEAVAGHLGGAS
ncbi:archaeal proteasome endopeptidase complex subunit alpha [Haloarchaeobius sp. HRN-SO-5]|uniref:archaeal proteasome endopeptidase complex subunit alpha n=1 Tax=Haloarchaeobius sp. HRN-SO-5 TaxID=3446118 RepID=UPI003EBE63AD